MQDISMLLKEAKPLYEKRKRSRRMFKNIAVGVTACSLLFGIGLQNFSKNSSSKILDDLYVYLYDEEVFSSKYHLMVQENEFYPVDEFGLIMVNV